MFGLIYRTFTYFLNPTALNKGERNQPAPLEDQERHLQRELARVRRERELLAERQRQADIARHGEDRDEGSDGTLLPGEGAADLAPEQEA